MATTVPVIISLVALLCLKDYQGVEAIDCYDCVSVAGSNLACEDEFRPGLSTLHLIARDCQYALFAASYCFKLKGIREDGTHFIVRRCADADWGTNCGDIQYLFEDKEERIQGCLTTCNYDGCNGASSLLLLPWSSSLPLMLLGVLATTLISGLLQSVSGLC